MYVFILKTATPTQRCIISERSKNKLAKISSKRTQKLSKMESDNGARNESILEAKMAELIKTKEELKRAKDRAMQSWLDSRPLIDELEKQQSALKRAKNQSSMLAISELESQLESTNTSIRNKKEEEHEARTMIGETGLASDQIREEMERLKVETDEERRARSKLKQVLRLRKQTLRTLQLTLRAFRLETEAFGASASEALRQINYLETDNTTVQLTQEDYSALTKRAKEETSLADWRISVSVEQRLVAEASRDSALRGLKESYSEKRMERRDSTRDRNIIREEEEDANIRVRDPGSNRSTPFPKARANLMAELNWADPQQKLRRSKRISNKRLVKKKKTSVFHQIRNFLVQKLTRLFG